MTKHAEHARSERGCVVRRRLALPRGRHAASYLAMALVALVATTATADVRYTDGKLDIRFSGEPLSTAVADVAAALGATVQGADPLEDPVTVDLHGVGVQEALERLLGRHGFALVYGADGRVRTIELQRTHRAAGEHAGPSTAVGHGTVIAPPPEPAEVAAPLIPHEVLGASVSLSRKSELWDMVVADPTVGEMLRIGLVTEEPRIRRQAFDAGLAAVESDPALQSQVGSVLDGLGDEQIESIRRMGKSEFAIELMRVLASSDQPQIRARAAELAARFDTK